MTEGDPIPGVSWSRVARHADARGSFREVWRDSWFGTLTPELTGMPEAQFVQANVSTSAAGVLRGLHYHRRQLDHWIVLGGRAFVALVDVRPTSGGADPVVTTREVGADETVTIPSGVAHGFLALEDLTLLYLVTNEYDGTDELGFRWDDEWAAVAWPEVRETPDGAPMLSERDRRSPSLRELIGALASG
ncbi:MAG TPA: dTDP-4-dehydrorhamnose 3,5-epimerase family protein [Candidatus Limnocylindria bacterium]|nr:dTDP-4-dehydrorhamnose 3,5-epimerase family protein [Candidatus Limnocylindria bacterium]